MWYIFALLSGFLAAVVAILTKLYLKNINPFFITFLFSGITVIFLLLVDLSTKKINCNQITCLTFKEWLPIIIAGLINGLSFCCYLGALKYGKAAGAVAIDRLGILFVVILSVFFLHEPLSIKSVAGAIMMILGAILLSL